MHKPINNNCCPKLAALTSGRITDKEIPLARLGMKVSKPITEGLEELPLVDFINDYVVKSHHEQLRKQAEREAQLKKVNRIFRKKGI